MVPLHTLKTGYFFLNVFSIWLTKNKHKIVFVFQGELSRGYESVKLSFAFPFYGHKISLVTISSKGYISTSPIPIEDDLFPVEKKSRKPSPLQVFFRFLLISKFIINWEGFLWLPNFFTVFFNWSLLLCKLYCKHYLKMPFSSTAKQ